MIRLNLNFLSSRRRRVAPRILAETRTSSFSWKHGILIKIVCSPKARRYLLRWQPEGHARLVIPRRGSQPEALRFLEKSEAWLLKRRDQWSATTAQLRQPWQDGAHFLFRGEDVVLNLLNTEHGVRLFFGDQVLMIPSPLPDYREKVFAHLRLIAEQELTVRTRELATQHGITVNRITVRAQKTRWGSCSARGTISLNWRVIQAPPFVVDYLIVHELMHRREMNHSARYWKLVAQAFPDYRAAELWLKKTRLESLA